MAGTPIPQEDLRRMRMNPSAARTRLGLALALTAGTLAAAAPAALAAPSITVTPFSDLDAAAPNALTVRGTGYTADAVTQSLGFYAGITATVDGTIYADMASARYLRDGFPDGPTRLTTDGRFETVVTANRRFTSGATEIDCAVTQCIVRTWRAHGNPSDTNLLAQKPIIFADPDPNAPVVTAVPSRELGAAPTEIAVSGTGFNPNSNRGLGFYAVYGPITATYWTQSSGAFGAFKRISAGATPSPSADVLNLDGSWSTRLTVQPLYTTREGTYNCRLVRCGILTFAAQGGSDRTLDTATPLSFTPLTPKVEVSPTTGLSRDAATTVTIRGSDFSTLAYASVTAIVDGRIVTPPARTSARYLRLNGPTPADTMNIDGSFETTLPVSPSFTTDSGLTVNCLVTQCAVSTWQHQTNPTPESLYTTAALTFAAAPVVPPVVPPVRPPVTPPALAPKAVVFKKTQTVGKNSTAAIGRVTSNVDATLSAPKSVKVKIGRKRYTLTVTVPKSVKAGKSATVKVKLSRKALAALKGRTVRVSVSVRVTANGRTSTVKTTGKITAKKAKKAAKKG